MILLQTTAYRRILLKLSGEALQNGNKKGILDDEYVGQICDAIRRIMDMGVQVAIVIGAGNIWRGARQGSGMDRCLADNMGMLATTINSLAVSDALSHHGVKSTVFSAVSMPKIAPLFRKEDAVSAMEEGRTVILAGGSGNPFFSTDTAAVLRAAELECDVVMMAKNVDGVYTADPHLDPSAVKIDEMTCSEILKNDLKVIDAAAAAFARDNRQTLLLFGITDPQNIVKIMLGDRLGTIVKGGN